MNDEFKWRDVDKTSQIEHLKKGMAPPLDAGIFGMSLGESDCSVVLLEVPWEPTTSYGGGTSKTPEGIIEPSHQLDLYDTVLGPIYEKGICFAEADDLSGRVIELWQEFESGEKVVLEDFSDVDSIPYCPPLFFHLSSVLKKKVEQVRKLEPDLIMSSFERFQVEDREGKLSSKENDLVKAIERETAEVNRWSVLLSEAVEKKALKLMQSGKKVGLVGGDHSSPYGLISALKKLHKDISILHIDAHFDYRKAYEGFTHSHASIMYNARASLGPEAKFFHLAVRDFSIEELNFAQSQAHQTKFLESKEIRKKIVDGKFSDVLNGVSNFLGEKVYVSFDIDGLDPGLCPGTGTPVPGGLFYDEAILILEHLRHQGKNIVGFDLCEVAGHTSGSEFDYNVGARVLYKLCGLL